MAKNELEAALQRSRNSSPDKTSPDEVILLTLSLSARTCMGARPEVPTHGHQSISHAHMWWLVERESYNISNSHCPCYHTSFVYSSTQIFTIGIIIILILSVINVFPRKWIQPQLLLERRKWSYCCKNWKEICRKHAMKRTKHCENWPVSSSICWKRLLS